MNAVPTCFWQLTYKWMQWCQTVIHNINVDCFMFPFFFLLHVVSFSFPPHKSPFASCFWTIWVDSLSAISTLTVLFFSLLSVFLSFSPTFCPVTALTGSDAGRDDSRACFSLWVYYLCSGPFKTTQNNPGSQCGEFALTSCLPLLIFLLLLLLLLLPCSFLLSWWLWGVSRRLWLSRDSLFPGLSPVSFGFSIKKASRI